MQTLKRFNSRLAFPGGNIQSELSRCLCRLAWRLESLRMVISVMAVIALDSFKPAPPKTDGPLSESNKFKIQCLTRQGIDGKM
jgi:hypothetical protein